jgi:hypothetical protein
MSYGILLWKACDQLLILGSKSTLLHLHIKVIVSMCWICYFGLASVNIQKYDHYFPKDYLKIQLSSFLIVADWKDSQVNLFAMF